MPREDGQFKKGHKRSKGRPKGARNKLANVWIKDLYELYLEVGKEKLRQAYDDRPDGVMKHIAALVPKDLDVKHSGDVTVNLINYTDDDEET